MFNLFAIVARLLILRNAIETNLWERIMLIDHPESVTGRKWNEMMDKGWTLTSVWEDEGINGTNSLLRISTDYGTQMRPYSWGRSMVGECCELECLERGWETCDEHDAWLKRNTQMTQAQAAEARGETGSVSIASLRLKRVRTANAIAKRVAAAPKAERKCDAEVNVRTNRAIGYLAKYGAVIRSEGIEEQQEIFETQMMRLGEHDTDVMEWRNDFETWPTFGEQIRSMSRFSRHQRSW